jgi:hypothetical protein
MKRFVTALGMCALLTCAASFATTYYWDGGHATQRFWNLTANWSTGVVPTANDNAVVSIEGNGWPQLYQNEEVAGLTMSSGSELNMDNGTSDCTLTVDGSISTTNAKFGGAGGTVIGESWSISGTIDLYEGVYRCETVE